MSHLLGKKVWPIQDRRGKIEWELHWRGGENQTSQPNQRPFQARCNGKDVRTGGIYTSGPGKKSNVIVPWAESISQETTTLRFVGWNSQISNEPKSLQIYSAYPILSSVGPSVSNPN
jgi:hypothetical protein